MAVHGRVPIKAAVKSPVHRLRAAHVGGIVGHVIGLVRIFFLDALQRQAREVRCLILRE